MRTQHALLVHLAVGGLGLEPWLKINESHLITLLWLRDIVVQVAKG